MGAQLPPRGAIVGLPLQGPQDRRPEGWTCGHRFMLPSSKWFLCSLSDRKW